MPNSLIPPSPPSRPSDAERQALSRDIEISRREFEEGKGIPHEKVMRNALDLILQWMKEERAVAV